MQLGIVRHDAIVDAEALKLAAKADAVVLAAGFDPSNEAEGADRTFQLPSGQDELIQEIAATNKNTIVVMTSGGSVDMNAWLDRVPALIEAWYPGQEGGTALAEILYGDVNPSGRLPASFERRWKIIRRIIIITRKRARIASFIKKEYSSAIAATSTTA
jgi:beta-glucosidase